MAAQKESASRVDSHRVFSVRDIHIEDLVRILPILCSNEEFYTPRPLSGRVLQKKLHFPK